MTKQEIEYTIIRNSVSTLVALCTGSEIKVIDLLTGYLWDEEEAGNIKRPLNQVVEDGQAKDCKGFGTCDAHNKNDGCNKQCYYYTPAT